MRDAIVHADGLLLAIRITHLWFLLFVCWPVGYLSFDLSRAVSMDGWVESFRGLGEAVDFMDGFDFGFSCLLRPPALWFRPCRPLWSGSVHIGRISSARVLAGAGVAGFKCPGMKSGV